MSLTASLVVTTIFDPIAIEGYFQNFEHHGHVRDVQVYVIPDRKTPSAAYERCAKLRKRGLKVVCPNPDEQEDFLRKVGFPPHLIPYNTDNRRNVGYLMALASGSDFIVSIDDDNYCVLDEDFLLAHSVVCERDYSATKVIAPNGWFNVCMLLEFDGPNTPYPRGFPYYARHQQENCADRADVVDVHINAGLWLRDPDLDAISWLVAPTHSVRFKGRSVVLGQKTWSPVNTQNTALRREAVAAYYFVKMGYPLSGMPIDRYGDIFSGYFVQACMRHLGGYLRVGTPIVDHRRNSHNFMKDASSEWACILVLEDILPWLTEVKLEGTDYPEVYTSLSYALEDVVETLHGSLWTDATRGYFHQLAYFMRLWARVTSQFL